MDKSSIKEDLRKIKALKGLPDEHLDWILDHSNYEEYEDGELVSKTGEPIESMSILLEGTVNFHMDVNGTLVYYFSFENDDTSGGVTGLLPYSRLRTSPGNSSAVGKLRVLKMHKKHFPELE